MTHRFWHVSPVLCVAIAAATVLHAQQVFRSSAVLVPVDVHAVDRDGRPVTDLTAADFVVLEDGVRQTIQHFVTQTFTPQPAPRTGGTLRTLATPTPSAEGALPQQTARVFLIVLGRGRLQVPNKGVDGALHLVRDRLLPQDLVAVLAYNRATDFTTDHAAVADLLERYKRQSPSIETKLAMYFSGLAALYRPPGIPPDVQREVDRIFAADGAPGARTLPGQQAPEDDRDAAHRRRVTETLLGDPDGREFAAFDRAEAAMVGMSFDQYAAAMSHDSNDLSNIQTGVTYLRHIDGEKHLVYISQGGVTMNVDLLARNASHARVALDVIHTGGLGFGVSQGPPTVAPRVGPGGSPMDDYLYRGTSLASVQQARRLATETGGTFYANLHPTAAGDIDAMDRAARFRYTLGYYPTRSTVDNRYRRIEVRVTRPGVTLQFRHGYYAEPPAPAINRREALSYTRIVRAFEYEPQIADIGITARARFVPSGRGGHTVAVDATVNPSRVTFETVKGRHVASLEMVVFLLDNGDRQVGQLWQRVDLNLLDATYAGTLRNGISYTATLDAPPQAKKAKLVAYDYAADLLGSVVVKIAER